LIGGADIDTASYSGATAGVVASLANAAINTGFAAGDTYNSVENLAGSKFDDSLFGNNSANVINGGAGNDTIKGYGGNDTLIGGAGEDTFNFNAGLDAATNVDTIGDFNVADDTVQLDNVVFTALAATGALASGFFRANATGTAQDSNDYIVYETDTGKLFYDADGNGAGAAIQFATLAGNQAITAADFVVI
jgi:serralysin